MYCDLHTHSLYSDGSFTPKELLRQAKEKNLVIALTDHNTVDGLPEFMAEAGKMGIAAVPGVELSTDWEDTEPHLLGLFIEEEHYARVTELTEEFHRLKEASNRLLVQRLQEAGYDIDFETVKRRNLTGNINRAHVAAELKEKGYVTSIKEALRTLLADGGGFYNRPRRLDLMDAIRFLHSIGAVPVLAHPLLDMQEDRLRRLLPEAMKAGLMGMEVWHESYDDEKTAIAKAVAGEFGLLFSGGSDYHGTAKPDVALGTGKGNVAVPVEVYHRLRQAAETKKEGCMV